MSNLASDATSGSQGVTSAGMIGDVALYSLEIISSSPPA